MSASPAEFSAEFPACPPVNYIAAELEAAELQSAQHEVSRRQFLKWSGILAAAGAVGSVVGYQDIVSPASQYFTNKRWPYRPTTIDFVNARAKISDRRHVALVSPGFGQMDSYNGAHEYAEAGDDSELTAYVSNTTGILTPQNMGSVMWDFIQEYDIQSMTLVGESLGTNVNLLSGLSVAERINQAIKGGRIDPSTTLPELRMTAANCSPPDVYEALKGDMGVFFSEVLDKANLPTDFISKYVYDLFDGDGDVQLTANFLNRQSWFAHFAETFDQANNDTSPYTAASQFKNFLLHFDWVAQSKDFQPLLNSNMVVAYGMPSDYDNVVDNSRSAAKWQAGFANAGVDKFYVINNGPGGHANTAAFAIAMSRFRRTLSDA